MSKLFIIRNQNGQYLSKQQEWLDGNDRNVLYRTVYRDEAINTVFEVSSRDIYLRAEALACDADARGNPLLGDGAVSAREVEPLIDADLSTLSAEVVPVAETTVTAESEAESQADRDEATA